MYRVVVLVAFGIVASQGGVVEQELLGQIVSPEVHADRTITFRLKAPQADTVLVQGLAGMEPQPLTKSAGGVWEVTVGPLAPELYSYTFSVDGAVVTDPHNRHVKKWLTVDSLVEVPGDPPLLHEQQRVPHGVVHHHVYDSHTAGCQRGVYVYTPPAYRADGTQRYPLLVLLHGYGDDESAWLEAGRAHWIADNLIAQGQVVPLVIAMPYGHPLPLPRSGSFDDYATPNRLAMEEDLLQDLVPLLESAYLLEHDRTYRAIAGLSMGGGQSLHIGLKHLDRFAWIAGFSSATPVGDMDREYASLLEQVSATNDRLKLLWVGCGKDDFLLERNERFRVWLADKGIRHVYRLTAGGHEWAVWRKYLAEVLPQLFR
ncbi:MAG: esterase [Planctomycetaceae bacterium]|nr:esterase [Planctomycetaceae bacterium]